MAEWRRRNDEAVDDFDDFDPTPYGGGYDIHLTFGRPIPPSEETCYPPNADPSPAVDYARPNYYGSAQPSEDEPRYGEDRYEAEERPSYQSGYGRRPDASEVESYGYGRRPEESEVQSYGYGYEEPKPKPYREDYEGVYGERPRYGQRRGEGEDSDENSDEEKEERRRYRRHDYNDD